MKRLIIFLSISMLLIITSCKSTTTQTVTVTSTVPVSQTPTQIQSTAPITVTKTTTITVTAPASQTPTPSSKPLTLSQFLQNNFSVCRTSLGPTRFTFTIDENDSILFPYDYWIQVEYDSEFFYDLKYSINISTEINHKVCEELKNFQEELARAVIELMPDKEFYGGYYDSWYRYPELQLELITRHYYIWVNYTPASGLAYYDETKVSEFQ